MTPTLLTIQLFASMIALIGAYALLLSIFKKQINQTWVRGESILTLICSGAALSILFPSLFEGSEPFLLASVLLLILGFGNALALAIVQHVVLRTTPGENEGTLANILPVLSIVAFSSLLLHVLLQFASIAGF